MQITDLGGKSTPVQIVMIEGRKFVWNKKFESHMTLSI